MSGERGEERPAGCAADAAAYVLGALTEEEHARFFAHLDVCAVCREEVAELQVVADVLPAAVPQLHAPPQLRARVLGTLAGVQHPDGAPSRPARVLARLRDRPPARSARRRAGIALAGLAGVAASVAALALALIALARSGPGATRVIHAEVLSPGARASLRVSAGRGELYISDMPAPAPARVYEVWVKRSAAAAPQPTAALFTVTRGGAAVVGVPGSLAGVKMVLVTSEPLGGSRVPTTSPVIIATLG